MKRIIPILTVLILFGCARANATVAIVQTVSNSGITASLVLTLSATAAGDFIVVAAGSATSFANSITDNKSSTYVGNGNGSQTGNFGQSWTLANCASGITSITIAYTGTPPVGAIAREYSGIQTSSPRDVAAATSVNAASTTMTSGTTSATTNANDLVIGWVIQNGNGVATPTLTAGSGYGNLAQQTVPSLGGTVGIEDKTVAATGTQTATFGSNLSDVGICSVSPFIIAAAATRRLLVNSQVM